MSSTVNGVELYDDEGESISLLFFVVHDESLHVTNPCVDRVSSKHFGSLYRAVKYMGKMWHPGWKFVYIRTNMYDEATRLILACIPDICRLCYVGYIPPVLCNSSMVVGANGLMPAIMPGNVRQLFVYPRPSLSRSQQTCVNQLTLCEWDDRYGVPNVCIANGVKTLCLDKCHFKWFRPQLPDSVRELQVVDTVLDVRMLMDVLKVGTPFTLRLRRVRREDWVRLFNHLLIFGLFFHILDTDDPEMCTELEERFQSVKYGCSIYIKGYPPLYWLPREKKMIQGGQSIFAHG